MRTKLTLLLLPLCLIGCSSHQKTAEKKDEQILRDYSDFSSIHLEWKNLFLPAKSQYFVYIYSFSCGHCYNIKQQVLAAIEANIDYFYLISYVEEIPTKNNVSETIGKEKVEEVAILGTPTLLEISDHHIALNIAGEKPILDYLELLPHTNCL